MCKRCIAAVERHFPEATDEDREYILWEETAFPMGPEDMVRRQIESASVDFGGNPLVEYDRAWTDEMENPTC